MENFKIIKCPSCGSSVVETESESIAECSHCGSKLILPARKFSKWVIFNALISVIVLIVAVSIFLNVNNQISTEPVDLNPLKKEPNNQPLIKQIPKINLVKPETKRLLISNEELKAFQVAQEIPSMKVVSKVVGSTVIGGKFWIVTISNDSDKTVSRPNVVMILFDTQGKRIDELKVWSKRDHLPAGEQTEILVLLSKPPQGELRVEIAAMAKFPTDFEIFQEKITINDYTIIQKDNNPMKVEFVGEVVNQHGFQVDFIEVVAVAKDIKGVAVGLAKSYISTTNLKPKQKSGFKVKASTFIAAIPNSWELWAVGRKHRPVTISK